MIFVFFSFDSCTDIILKQLNKIKKLFFLFFHFSFFSAVSRFVSPVVLPYCGPCCTTPLLGRSPRANRCENWWLRTCAHLQKNISKICDFRFFSFDLCTGIILKQLNKIKNLNMLFFHFSFFSVVSPGFFPVVLPYCGPCCLTALFTPLRRHRDCRGDRELLAFIFHQHARALAQNAHPDSLHWDHRPGETPRGDTTGRHNAETCKTGKQNGKQNRKVISIKIKSI